MSIHNAAQKGDIAPKVLLPGDPLRAKFIAENYMSDILCYNQVRNTLGYTGIYQGERISVQSTGMGVPSISIYAEELIREYDVKQLIRIGTCGTIHHKIELNDIIVAMSACTDSNVNKIRFNHLDYAPTASYTLLTKAMQSCSDQNIHAVPGTILTSDHFYIDFGEHNYYQMWSKYGVLAIEMETAALYTIASRYEVDALAILQVTDNIVTNQHLSADDRQNGLDKLIRTGLSTII